MDEEEITFVQLHWHITGWKQIEHVGESIVIASPMLRRAVREHWRVSAMDHLNHRRHYHIEYTSPMFTRACWEHRQCVADVSVTFLTFVYLSEYSPTTVHWSALLCDISPMVLGDKTWIFQCPDALVKHGDYSRTSLMICRATGEWWRCPNLCITKTSGGLKTPWDLRTTLQWWYFIHWYC